MPNDNPFPERANQLFATLRTDLDSGVQQLRSLFFTMLSTRQLNDCENLLELLLNESSIRIQKEIGYLKAILLFEQRNFTEAERIVQELLSAPDELSDELHARLYRTSALLSNEQGRMAEAQRYLEESSTRFANLGDQLEVAKNYNNLGVLICDRVRYDPALPQVQHESQLRRAVEFHCQVVDILNQIKEPQPLHQFMRIRTLRGQGIAHGLLQEYDAARVALEEQIRLCRELGEAARFDLANGLQDLIPATDFLQGDYESSRQALTEAIELLRSLNDPFVLREALQFLGQLHQRQNQFDEALTAYHAAIQATESIRARITAPTSQAGHRIRQEAIYKAPLTIHLQRNDAKQAFDAAERARSQVLVDLLASQSASVHSQIPHELSLQRQGLYEALDNAYRQGNSQDEIETLEEALLDMERQIELVDPAYHLLTTSDSMTLAQVQQALPQDAALLTYISDADDQFWAMVVTKQEPPLIKQIPRITVTWLESHLLAYLNPDGRHYGRLTPNRIGNSTRLLALGNLFRDLYAAFVEPVWEQLKDVKTTYIVPTGPLHYVPIGALSPEPSQPPPLMNKGRSVVYAPSATVLLNYCHQRQASSHQSSLSLAPRYDDLKFIAGAAETITQGTDGTTLLNEQATAQALLNEGKHYRIVAFLGHAVFNQQYPMASYLRMADRNLRASEILQSLRLHTDLVILAACESGRSNVLRGDELMGLSRALLYAGTPSLLVTLWKVHEVPTRLLIEKFFEELSAADEADNSNEKRVPTPAIALATAQRWLRTLRFADARIRMLDWVDSSPNVIDEELMRLRGWTAPTDKDGVTKEPTDDDKLFAHPHFWSAYILIGDQGTQATPTHHRAE